MSTFHKNNTPVSYAETLNQCQLNIRPTRCMFILFFVFLGFLNTHNAIANIIGSGIDHNGPFRGKRSFIKITTLEDTPDYVYFSHCANTIGNREERYEFFASKTFADDFTLGNRCVLMFGGKAIKWSTLSYMKEAVRENAQMSFYIRTVAKVASFVPAAKMFRAIGKSISTGVKIWRFGKTLMAMNRVGKVERLVGSNLTAFAAGWYSEVMVEGVDKVQAQMNISLDADTWKRMNNFVGKKIVTSTSEDEIKESYLSFYRKVKERLSEVGENPETKYGIKENFWALTSTLIPILEKDEDFFEERMDESLSSEIDELKRSIEVQSFFVDRVKMFTSMTGYQFRKNFELVVRDMLYEQKESFDKIEFKKGGGLLSLNKTRDEASSDKLITEDMSKLRREGCQSCKNNSGYHNLYGVKPFDIKKRFYQVVKDELGLSKDTKINLNFLNVHKKPRSPEEMEKIAAFLGHAVVSEYHQEQFLKEYVVKVDVEVDKRGLEISFLALARFSMRHRYWGNKMPPIVNDDGLGDFSVYNFVARTGTAERSNFLKEIKLENEEVFLSNKICETVDLFTEQGRNFEFDWSFRDRK